MVQHNHEHLTIAQLSAYLDQELASDELTLCDTHLQDCQPCQAALTDLQLTSALLHEMPQVEVPRSFVLPANLIVLPVTPASQSQPTRLSGRGQYIVKRTMRALSTIAAVIGLVFILFGALTAVPHYGTSTANTTAPRSMQNAASHTASTDTTKASGTHQPSPSGTQPGQSVNGGTPDSIATPTPQSIASSGTTNTPTGDHEFDASQSLPSALDLGQPTGRLSIGGALLILGILGVILTRRFRYSPE